MPELPDVEVFRRRLEETSLQRRIEAAEVRTPEMLSGRSPLDLRLALVGQAFTGTRRHGKYLFVQVSDAPWLVLHFGMTGDLVPLPPAGEEPAHTRLVVTFEAGDRLAYDCTRKLGEIGLTPSVPAFVLNRDLGPDVMALGGQALGEILARHRGTVKYTLMNQHIVAGLGNVYTDECLFQAGIAPVARADRLDGPAVGRLHDAIQEVLRVAIDCEVDPDRFPEGFLLRRRTEGAECPRCGATVQRVQVAGRSTYFCAGHQTPEAGA